MILAYLFTRIFLVKNGQPISNNKFIIQYDPFKVFRNKNCLVFKARTAILMILIFVVSSSFMEPDPPKSTMIPCQKITEDDKGIFEKYEITILKFSDDENSIEIAFK